MWAHFLTPVFLHESSRINRCQQHVNDRKWTRIARSLLESQLPLKIILFTRMCALHFFFLLVEPCAEFTCYSLLVLCHCHFPSRVNAQQWSPRKHQALHSIGSFRSFLLALFFVPTYHSQPSVTLLSVCRELQASDEKNLTSQLPCVFALVTASVWRTHVHVRIRQIDEENSTCRVPVAPSVDLNVRSFFKPVLACEVNEVFNDRLFIFSFLCESVETEMTQERDQKRHQKRDFETRTHKVSTV